MEGLIVVIILAGLSMIAFYLYNNTCKHCYDQVDPRTKQCKKCGKTIVIPCAHEWETLETSKITRPGSDGRDLQIGYLYTLKCKKCGELASRTSSI